MELKQRNAEGDSTKDLCFNRTFMELKLIAHALHIVKAARFNRTFMELKRLLVERKYIMSSLVLIGPSWN